ncbi:MAG: hypothetical protein KKA10_17345 [Euryarchaeota archaeon]|nr:hypothetical protein [Euryarchaeota archaeon]MCG2738154.1 hypothetical protein [Candidatus Methanoperedenaceae archaeon]
MDIEEQREYIVSAITDIGHVASRNLLSYFGSVENVMRASQEELTNVKYGGLITVQLGCKLKKDTTKRSGMTLNRFMKVIRTSILLL